MLRPSGYGNDTQIMLFWWNYQLCSHILYDKLSAIIELISQINIVGKLYFAVVATITRQYKPIVLVGSFNNQKYPQFHHNSRVIKNGNFRDASSISRSTCSSFARFYKQTAYKLV